MDLNASLRTAAKRRLLLGLEIERSLERSRRWNRIQFATAWCGICSGVYVLVQEPLALPDLHAGFGIIEINSLAGLIFLVGVAAALVAIPRAKRAEAKLDNLRNIDARLAKAGADAKELERLFDSKEPFILYLRDFNTGRSRQEDIVVARASAVSVTGVSHPWVWPIQFGSATTSAILDAIPPQFKTVFLDNPADRTDTSDGLVVYCEDRDWEDTFHHLAERAAFVIVDVRFSDQLSLGVDKELKHLSDGRMSNVILVGCRQDVVILRSKYCEISSNAAMICTLADGFDRGEHPDRIDDLRKFLREEVTKLPFEYQTIGVYHIASPNKTGSLCGTESSKRLFKIDEVHDSILDSFYCPRCANEYRKYRKRKLFTLSPLH